MKEILWVILTCGSSVNASHTVGTSVASNVEPSIAPRSAPFNFTSLDTDPDCSAFLKSHPETFEIRQSKVSINLVSLPTLTHLLTLYHQFRESLDCHKSHQNTVVFCGMPVAICQPNTFLRPPVLRPMF